MAFRPISRRTVLKGVGVSIALPFLEAMIPTSRVAQAAALAAPRRLVFVYFPNGAKMDAWNVTGEGADFELSRTLSSFKEHKLNMLIISSLADQNAKGGGA